MGTVLGLMVVGSLGWLFANYDEMPVSSLPFSASIFAALSFLVLFVAAFLFAKWKVVQDKDPAEHD